MEKLKNFIEFALAKIFFAAFRTLPLDMASYIGGFMARAIGPFLPAQRIAYANLSMVFPEWTTQQKRHILDRMWDNLGRNTAELAHLPGDALYGRMTLHGIENLPENGKPAIFFSGHLGNWELSYPVVHRHGHPVTLIYREANNPYVDKMINGIRATQSAAMLPKGAKGAIRLGRAIKDGQTLAMLVDQKMNEGIAVPFFCRDAMTATAIAEFALRYDLPLIPGRIVRTRGCHFEGHVYPALVYEKTGDADKDTLSILTHINALLESWIREHPEQWFWVHRRWPKAEL